MSQFQCTKCHITKSSEEFHKSKSSKRGHISKCRECVHKELVISRGYCKDKRVSKDERIRLLNNNKDQCSECRTIKDLSEFVKNQHRCKKCTIDKNNEYRRSNPEKYMKSSRKSDSKRRGNRSKYSKEYRSRPNVVKHTQEHERSRYKNDIHYRLKKILRARVYAAITKCKPGSHIKDLGCSVEELKIYLESKFYNHPITNKIMTWEDLGKGYNKFQIDHIQEIHNLDISSRKDFLIACHYTNLQPLWFEDHIVKTIKNS